MTTLLLMLVIKASIVLLAGLGATFLLRHRSAALSHAVLSAAIVAALGMPFFTAVAPALRMPVPAAAADGSTSAPRAASVELSFGLSPAARPAAATADPLTVTAGVLAVWAAGTLAMLIGLAAGVMRLAFVARRAQRVAAGPIKAVLDDLCARSDIRREVVLLEADRPALIVAWGWRRPRVLLPTAARQWPRDRTRMVLRHELAHLDRADWVVQLAGELLRALYWFNPLVWMACRWLRDASERACDDAVLADGVEASDYATHLLDIARTFHAGRAWLPAPAMARHSSLEGRITAMLNASADRRPLGRVTLAAVVAAFIAIAVPVSGIAGQSAFHTVSGLVVDATNSFVPGATVRLTNPASGATHEIKTDAAGRFELVGVPTAEYVLDVSQPGFARFRQGRLLIAGNLERTVELQVGSIEETVSVGAGADGAAAVPIAAKLEEARARAEAAARRVAERCAGHSAASSSARAPGIGGNILAPRKLLDVYPEYPEHLQQAGVTGTVTLAARIGTDGRIVDIVATNEAHPELERAAIDAVRQWEFTPTYLNCTPIEVRMQVTANFARPK